MLQWPKISKNSFGFWAEELAVLYLRLKFYHIIARRVGRPIGEIDIVALRGSSIIFVEVKAKTNHIGDMLVTTSQQQRITRSAQMFIAKHARFQSYDVRFDVIVMEPWCIPRHIKNAWG
jgi:putative endonuclease